MAKQLMNNNSTNGQVVIRSGDLNYMKNQSAKTNASFKLLFLLPVQGGSGGAHSVVQESLELYRYGIDVKIAVINKKYPTFLDNYKDIPEIQDMVVSYEDIQDLKVLAQSFSVVCATIYNTVQDLQEILEACPHIMPAYYIQDYEPFFSPKDTENWIAANNSYTKISNAVLFAKTQWLCDVIKHRHNVVAYKVEPSIDHQVYYPNFRRSDDMINISVMVRFTTARRAPSKTLRVIKILSDLFPHKVKFTIFGSDPQRLESCRIPTPNNTQILGLLTRPEVASVLRQSDVFLDLSDYQAFGRTALEAMASGTVSIVPCRGGSDEFAVPFINSLAVNTFSERECVNAIARLIHLNPESLFQMKLNAVETASRYSTKRAAMSILNCLYPKFIQQQK